MGEQNDLAVLDFWVEGSLEDELIGFAGWTPTATQVSINKPGDNERFVIAEEEYDREPLKPNEAVDVFVVLPIHKPEGAGFRVREENEIQQIVDP